MDSRLEVIKQRMIDAGISADEVDNLVKPLASELERRVCGLVWKHEGATTKLVEEMEGKLPVLTPVKDKNIVTDINGINHVLIEGENLLTLMAMQYTHIDEGRKGKIDVIYIDPPYNTGSVSFAYNDKFEKSEWLSMMDIRLKLARNLLKDDGVIFVQLDEGYQAELKLLMNEIFGQDKHAVTLHVEMSATQGMKVKAAQSGTVVKNAEYVMVYTKDGHKDIAKTLLYDYRPEYDKHYNKMLLTGDVVVDLKEEFNKRHPNDKIVSLSEYKTNAAFQKFVTENTESIFRYDKTTGFIVSDYVPGKIYRVERNGRTYTIVVKNNKVAQLLFLADSFGVCDDSQKSYGLRKIRGDLWKDFYKDMGNVSKEGNVVFENGKKPIRLIKQLLKMVTRSTGPCTVLDFFAGSGTTGHAVLDLNKEDGGHRQFILCTNNELGKNALKTAKKNGYVAGSEEYEDLGVCHAVTYPRLKTVITGERIDGSKYSDGMAGNNLYYYQVSDSITESPIPKITKDALAKQAVSYIALKENIFNVDEHKDYHILHNVDTEIIVVIDPDRDYRDVQDNIASQAFSKVNRKVYCSLKRRTVVDGVEYIPYPEEVLDVLKSVKKRVRKESKR